jgi:hypothetical protein
MLCNYAKNSTKQVPPQGFVRAATESERAKSGKLLANRPAGIMMMLAICLTLAGGPMKRYWFSSILALPIVFLALSAAKEAGGDKATPWKPFLSGDAYKELTGRSIKAIEAAAKSGDKNALAKIELEAALLAGFTLSVKNANDDDVAKLRGAALAARKQDLKKLAEFGQSIKTAPKALGEVKDWKSRLPELEELMVFFRNKSKGGEGLHADLQYQPKLENLNGIEALIGALSKKKLNDANMQKVAKELPILAYRVAVFSAVTHEFAPSKGAGQWRDLSNQMRDASIALADAAQNKNVAGVQKAAEALDNTCTQCHSAFKNK